LALALALTREREITPYVWVHPDDEMCGRRFTPAGFSFIEGAFPPKDLQRRC
jgi:hypothetical protein